MDTRERRPDLERATYKRPPYLSGMIFPMLPKAVKQGTLYYSSILSDATVEDDRTSGDAPTEEKLTDSHTSFDLDNDEFIDREKVPQQEIEGMGGLEAAQMKMARVGKRAVAKGIEDLTCDNILKNGSVTYHDILDSLIAEVDEGVSTVMDYAEGGERIALVCSHKVFSRIKRYSAVIERMKFTGVLPASINDVRGISAQQLAAALNVDAVLVGPNSEWYSDDSDFQERAALVALPEPNIDPIEVPQVGRTVWFEPDGETPSDENALFTVHSWYSENKISEMVDVQAFAEQNVLNTELIYGLKGIDESNAVTTTTTTT